MKMKHIIYMDTDIINSYISQINNGLLTKSIEEKNKGTGSSSNEIYHGDSKIKEGLIGISTFGIKYGVSSGGKDEEYITERNEYAKELIEKMYHDNLLNQVIKYLYDSNLLKTNNNFEIGDFVNIEMDFDVLDLDNAKQVASKENLKNMDMVANFDFLNMSDKSNNQNNNTKNKTNNQKFNDNALKAVDKMFQILDIVLPCKKMILGDNICCPVNEKFLREPLPQIKFKYSGKVQVIGKATRKMSDSNNINSIVGVSDLLPMLTDITEALFVNQDSIIITPIALFFE